MDGWDRTEWRVVLGAFICPSNSEGGSAYGRCELLVSGSAESSRIALTHDSKSTSLDVDKFLVLSGP